MSHENHDRDFQSLYEDAPLAYQSLGDCTEILLVNREWLHLLGYGRDEVIGRPLQDFLTADSAALLADRVKVLRRQGYNRAQEFDMVHKDGSVVPVRMDGRLVTGGEDGVERTHCIVQDMRPAVEARRARDESEGRYRRLVELAREGIWEIDAASRTVYVNPAMAEMLGYAADEMVGRGLFEFMTEPGRDLCRRNLARQENCSDGEYDFEFVTKSGRRIITNLETRPIFGEDGTYTGALAGVVDVTARRRFEQEMMRTQKLESLGVLAGGIAHEFNNLLQAMIGNTELALGDAGDNHLVQESLREIQRATGRASDLCRQMLAYAGKGRFQVTQVDLARLVEEMEGILKVSCSQSATFEMDLAADLPLVEADASQLGQVVLNLVTNAAESLGEREGVLRIVVKAEDLTADEISRRFARGELQPGRCVVLSVSDTGCGMDQDTRRNIFDPFFTTKFTGRGLGLAAVLGIVKGHDGAIAVASEPGDGTTVTVALPASTAPGALPDAVFAASRERRPAALTVLVAEDEPGVQNLIRRLLERLGHKVHLARDGREAVDQYRRHGAEIDVVMLDLTMPVLDGRQAMLEIHKQNPAVPVIICTGLATENIAPDFSDDQPAYFLQKPFAVDRLAAILDKCRRP